MSSGPDQRGKGLSWARCLGGGPRSPTSPRSPTGVSEAAADIKVSLRDYLVGEAYIRSA